ncbi:MAG: hypothetical protein KAS72_04640 [Phycisphaerales bacterium]|nr:hypothetical protein [Phycisphaerales bacterium]
MRVLHPRTWLASLGALVMTATAHAQEYHNFQAPSPNASVTPKVWITYAILLVLAGAVIGISLTPSKRGHQD